VNIRLLALLTVTLFTLGMISPSAFGDATSNTIFYTTFVNTPDRVYSVDYSYDGVANFQVMNDVSLCSGIGADGISQNPQNPDLLLVGGQTNLIHTCSKSTGVTVTTTSNGPSIFHLEVPDATSVYGNGICGQPVFFTINPDGTVNPGQPVAMAGSDASWCQLIDTPAGFFYASNIIYGTVNFANPTTATTARLHGPGGSISGSVPGNGAHGGVYDPFSNTVITFGSNTVNQFDLTGNLIGTRAFGGAGFDQGTVDGNGHLFIASNPNLFFLDYSADGNIANAAHFSSLVFVKSALDDVAPLVGAGSTDPCPPGTTGTPPECIPDEREVGGEFLPIETTSLLLAAASSPAAWLTSLTIVALGIGAYVFTRNSNNMRNIKVILRDYLDRL